MGFNLISSFFGITAILIIVVEIYLNFSRKRSYYRYVDVVTNIQTLFLYQMLGAVALGFIYVCYSWIYENLALFRQNIESPLAWIGGFILADFCHYWFHRSSHQNNFLWGIHQGHHTSEDFNLSTALRKGIFQLWIDWPFFLPMAILGFPFFTMYLPLKGLQFTYQFWLHNQFVGKIPYLEKILVTPSAHRVHHGQNPQYIDKNHAGVFIIWDKLFGTFAEEVEPVVYGTTEAVNSFNPIGIQFVWWRNLIRDAVDTKSWSDRLMIPFKATGWRPADVDARVRENKIESLENHKPHSIAIDWPLKLYLAVQLIFMGLVFGSTSSGSDYQIFTNPLHSFSVLYLVFTCMSLGMLTNRTQYAIQIEWVRLLSLAALSVWAVSSGAAVTIFQTVLIISSVSFIGFALIQFYQRPPRSLTAMAESPDS